MCTPTVIKYSIKGVNLVLFCLLKLLGKICKLSICFQRQISSFRFCYTFLNMWVTCPIGMAGWGRSEEGCNDGHYVQYYQTHLGNTFYQTQVTLFYQTQVRLFIRPRWHSHASGTWLIVVCHVITWKKAWHSEAITSYPKFFLFIFYFPISMISEYLYMTMVCDQQLVYKYFEYVLCFCSDYQPLTIFCWINIHKHP